MSESQGGGRYADSPRRRARAAAAAAAAAADATADPYGYGNAGGQPPPAQAPAPPSPYGQATTPSNGADPYRADPYQDGAGVPFNGVDGPNRGNGTVSGSPYGSAYSAGSPSPAGSPLPGSPYADLFSPTGPTGPTGTVPAPQPWQPASSPNAASAAPAPPAQHLPAAPPYPQPGPALGPGGYNPPGSGRQVFGQQAYLPSPSSPAEQVLPDAPAAGASARPPDEPWLGASAPPRRRDIRADRADLSRPRARARGSEGRRSERGRSASGRTDLDRALSGLSGFAQRVGFGAKPRRDRSDRGGRGTSEPQTTAQTAVSAVSEVLVVLGMALALSLVIKTFLVQAFFIPSQSMQDSLQVGDRVLVSKLTPGPLGLDRGDVIVFKDPGGWLEDQPEVDQGAVRRTLTAALTFVGLLPQDSGEHLIKRVIGLPGDTVKCCDAQGRLAVNGTPVDEAYVRDGNKPSQEPFSTTVKPDSLWVMGDNRSQSWDSRFHLELNDGQVPMDNVVGKAFVVVWPFSRFGGVDNPSSVFGRVQDPPTGQQ